LSLDGDQYFFSEAVNTDVAHRPILIVGTLTKFQHVLMYIGNYGMSIYNQLGLKKGQLAAAG